MKLSEFVGTLVSTAPTFLQYYMNTAGSDWHKHERPLDAWIVLYDSWLAESTREAKLSANQLAAFILDTLSNDASDGFHRTAESIFFSCSNSETGEVDELKLQLQLTAELDQAFTFLQQNVAEIAKQLVSTVIENNKGQ